jgi:hypothetical protein
MNASSSHTRKGCVPVQDEFHPDQIASLSSATARYGALGAKLAGVQVAPLGSLNGVGAVGGVCSGGA